MGGKQQHHSSDPGISRKPRTQHGQGQALPLKRETATIKSRFYTNLTHYRQYPARGWWNADLALASKAFPVVYFKDRVVCARSNESPGLGGEERPRQPESRGFMSGARTELAKAENYDR
ncbi:hypothetical protein FRC12_020831 [Ceratobasidium sp. 428]|nr:hypothetical protein FRC12_020831 [Ceratobasidium sp. 428]